MVVIERADAAWPCKSGRGRRLFALFLLKSNKYYCICIIQLYMYCYEYIRQDLKNVAVSALFVFQLLSRLLRFSRLLTYQ